MNIIIVLIILIVLGVGGFYLFKMEQERAAEEKRIADVEAKLEDTSKFITYSECDYKGNDYEHSLLEGHDSGILQLKPPVKSIIIPKGLTVDTYTKPEKGGVKISYSGPVAHKCLSPPIPYFEFKKE
jgi:hypothetical protein